MTTPSSKSESLDSFKILSRMDFSIRESLTDLQIVDSIDSTNTAVQRLPIEQQHGTVIMAEQQNAGRGRRGKNWHSPHGQNLYMSIGWRFEKKLTELGCLPLVLALSAASALHEAGLKGHKVKWPNDILLDNRKLAGILVEMNADPQGPCNSVLGIGLNVHMPASAEIAAKIGQPWTNLESHLPGCSRNSLAALLLDALLTHLPQFAAQGFEPFKPMWDQYDGLNGKFVDVISGTDTIYGMAAGIDEQGALLLDTGGGAVQHLHSAEVSLTPRSNRQLV
jgi:BirA family biotin operon repressor/biotin-[acetyl-CoA-carboxylase] ligase